MGRILKLSTDGLPGKPKSSTLAPLFSTAGSDQRGRLAPILWSRLPLFQPHPLPSPLSSGVHPLAFCLKLFKVIASCPSSLLVSTDQRCLTFAWLQRVSEPPVVPIPDWAPVQTEWTARTRTASLSTDMEGIFYAKKNMPRLHEYFFEAQAQFIVTLGRPLLCHRDYSEGLSFFQVLIWFSMEIT